MRIKLDEDLSPLVGEPFRAAGHGVQSVVGQGWGGLNDADLWSRVCSAQEYFVTAEKGSATCAPILPEHTQVFSCCDPIETASCASARWWSAR
jgi:hypothetical protein